MKRVPRDISVHLFRREREGVRFLMLRRLPHRGGFWQGVTGAPLPGETDIDAAIREVRKETRYDVRDSLVSVTIRYHYALPPERADRWRALYGPGVATISVVTFGAEVPRGVSPVLDAGEHDAFA